MKSQSNVFIETINAHNYLSQQEMLLINKNEISNGTFVSLLEEAKVRCRYITEHDFICAFRDLFDSFTISEYRNGNIFGNWQTAWNKFSSSILHDEAEWSVMKLNNRFHLIAQQQSVTIFTYNLSNQSRYNSLVYNY